jgi:glycosyltransferase involved in cell wall biosynthesis
MSDATKIERSLVVPVYKNEANISDLIQAINESIMPVATAPTEVVFVVDGSPDRAHELLRTMLPKQSWPSQLVSHSRNFGSICAMRTGIAAARGKAIAVMAADLQEPPSLVIQFWDILRRDEADIVFGQRTNRHDTRASMVAASIFWTLYRKLVFREVPPGGVDVFAINDRVREAILGISEPNSSLIAQLLWVGFRRTFVPYVRQPRRRGRSAWTFGRKLNYMVDNFVAFTDLPIMVLIWLGAIGVIVTGTVGLVVLVARLAGLVALPGYTPIMLMLAFGFSTMLVSQGILGLYLWRTFENTKRRPLAIVSEHLTFGGERGADDT